MTPYKKSRYLATHIDLLLGQKRQFTSYYSHIIYDHFPTHLSYTSAFESRSFGFCSFELVTDACFLHGRSIRYLELK